MVGAKMTASELANLLEVDSWYKLVTREEIATMLRQLQKERDLLFNAHSHEMKRADELQIECARLYRIIELNGKIE
jgi:RecA/RadA recombinase